MKREFLKSKKTIILLATMSILAIPTISKANVQSRPGATSLVNKEASDFFLLCRQMETSTGPLGLNATIEVQSNKVVETSSANNIDAHMIKNTEYGTAAMLAASPYGDCPSGSSSSNDSTTKNKSGIMQMASGQWEYVAGIYNSKNYYNTYIYNADAKYKNLYNSNTASEAYIPGDATYETQNWKDASLATFVNSYYTVFERSCYGVFCYIHNSDQNTNSGSRAAVVCGEGF